MNQADTSHLNSFPNGVFANGPDNSGLEILKFTKSIASIRTRSELSRMLENELISVLNAQEIKIMWFDQQRGVYIKFITLNPSVSPAAPSWREICGREAFIQNINQPALINKQPICFYTQELSGHPDTEWVGEALIKRNILSLVSAPLSKGEEVFGNMYIGWGQVHRFNALNIELMAGVVDQIAIAIANILANEALTDKEEKNAMLLSLSNSIATIRNKKDLFGVIDKKLKKIIPYDNFVICLINEDGQTHSPYLYNQEDDFQSRPGVPPKSQARYSLDDGLCRKMMASACPLVFDIDELMQWPDVPEWMSFWHNMGIKEMTAFAIMEGDKCTGFFYLYARDRGAVSDDNHMLLQSIGLQVSVAITNIRANEKIERQLQEIDAYKQQLEQETLYLREHLELSFNAEEIVGTSASLKNVFRHIEQVSGTDSTVLILGETGTGKELVARAIHESSPRKNKLMIKINCAALPPNLIESELFGHEKGAFTGATERRIGKFELAQNSTIFLDEVGELPPDLQVKLLRALQEKEIERIGGKGVIKVDARIIAATNRNLYKEVQEGTFRSDLYYRLNVFPIVLPPLRERTEDIPTLAAHFANKYSRRVGKNITGISRKVLKSLSSYHWPGNVRELEHLIERSVLLTSGSVINEIHLPKFERRDDQTGNVEIKVKNLFENERDHILAMLKICNGKIAGPGGAAELLNIPPTTLNSKLKKFKIKREHILI